MAVVTGAIKQKTIGKGITWTSVYLQNIIIQLPNILGFLDKVTHLYFNEINLVKIWIISLIFALFAVDLIGGLALIFSASLTVFSVGTAFVILVLNLDPMYLFSRTITNTIFSDYVSNPWFQIVLFFSNLIRLVFCYLVSNWLLVNIRTLVIVQLTSDASLVNLENILLTNCQTRLSNCISLYKQLTIERNTLLSFGKVTLTGFLTVVFFFLILSMAAIEIGVLLGSPLISAAGAVASVIVFAVFVVTINLCCLIYEKSVKIRNLWKWRIQKERDTKYFRRVIRSLKPLIVPAGDMGKVDKEMKMNYSHAVLVNSVNLLIGLGEFVGL